MADRKNICASRYHKRVSAAGIRVVRDQKGRLGSSDIHLYTHVHDSNCTGGRLMSEGCIEE